MEHENIKDSQLKKLGEVAVSCLKLDAIGFGGIAGMVATIEDEMVVRRKWIDHQHFMDVLSTSYIIPGPNAVEVVMHCGYERVGAWDWWLPESVTFCRPCSFVCCSATFISGTVRCQTCSNSSLVYGLQQPHWLSERSSGCRQQL